MVKLLSSRSTSISITRKKQFSLVFVCQLKLLSWACWLERETLMRYLCGVFQGTRVCRWTRVLSTGRRCSQALASWSPRLSTRRSWRPTWRTAVYRGEHVSPTLTFLHSFSSNTGLYLSDGNFHVRWLVEDNDVMVWQWGWAFLRPTTDQTLRVRGAAWFPNRNVQTAHMSHLDCPTVWTHTIK